MDLRLAVTHDVLHLHPGWGWANPVGTGSTWSRSDPHRVLGSLQALLMFRPLLHGFRNRDLRGLASQLLGHRPNRFSPGQTSYDLRPATCDDYTTTASSTASPAPTATASATPASPRPCSGPASTTGPAHRPRPARRPHARPTAQRHPRLPGHPRPTDQPSRPPPPEELDPILPTPSAVAKQVVP